MSDLNELIHTNAHRAYEQGVQRERERIIKLAGDRVCFNHKNGCDHADCYSLSDLIRLIKGEQK